jgi:hypothetical protein
MIEEDPRMGALRYMHSEVNTEIAWHTHLNGQFDRILVKTLVRWNQLCRVFSIKKFAKWDALIFQQRLEILV